MNYISLIYLFSLFCLAPRITFAQSTNKSDWPVITRKGDQLYEGKKVFRFFGLAAPNIQQNESQIKTDYSN